MNPFSGFGNAMIALFALVLLGLLIAISWLTGSAILTTLASITILAIWGIWELTLHREGTLPFVGGMISGWRKVPWNDRQGLKVVIPEIALNVLVSYRLIFILPIVLLWT